MINKRQVHRGLVEKQRRKKFNYLKNTGQLENYYKTKEMWDKATKRI